MAIISFSASLTLDLRCKFCNNITIKIILWLRSDIFHKQKSSFPNNLTTYIFVLLKTRNPNLQRNKRISEYIIIKNKIKTYFASLKQVALLNNFTYLVHSYRIFQVRLSFTNIFLYFIRYFHGNFRPFIIFLISITRIL